jgi:hypothetical protein
VGHWLERARIETGPLFRPPREHQTPAAERPVGGAHREALREALNLRSTHSLLSGLATAAVMADVSERSIRAQTGHKSPRRYVREGSPFRRNAAAAVATSRSATGADRSEAHYSQRFTCWRRF